MKNTKKSNHMLKALLSLSKKVSTPVYKLVNNKLFRKIRVRLIASFLVPVALIILLGIVSFSKASDGITTSYVSATSQAINMAGDYLAFGLDSVRATGSQYINDDSIKKYLIGLYDSDLIEKNLKLSEINNSFYAKKVSDKFISDIYIISKNYNPISTLTSVPPNFYGEFMDTSFGKDLKQNILKEYWVGSEAYLDEKLSVGSDQYAIRLVRMIPKADAILIINVEMKAVQEVLDNLGFDEAGFLSVVTADGKEINHANATINDVATDVTNEPIFIDTEFYREAVGSEMSDGTKLVQYKNQSYLFMYSKIGNTGAMICGLVPRAVILGQADSIKNLTIIIVIISIIVAVGIACFIASGIDKVINNIISKLRIAAKGDLSVEFNIKRSDEFMILIEEIQLTFSNMKKLIQQVKDLSSEVSDSSEEVTGTSEHFLHSAEEIAGAMNEIEASINQQAKDAEECLSQMDKLSNRIVLVSDNTKEISIIAENTKQRVQEGTISTNELNTQTKETAKIAAEIIHEIQNLEKKSSSIGKIVNVINDLANQTNLLSLNASIEAARVGSAGKGFAVVASEIRKLAELSKESVNNINSIIVSIQTDTQNAVTIAKQAEDVMRMQENAVKNTTESYQNINESVENLVVYLKHISENVDNIEEARVSTLGAIESISAVLEEIAATSNNINQAAGEQLASVEVLNKSTGSLNTSAGDLVNSVTKFKI